MKTTLEISITHSHDIYYNDLTNYNHVYLLLHGFAQNGNFLYKRFLKFLPKDSLIVSPNGPFLHVVKKDKKYHPTFAWYFYDTEKDYFYINYKPSAEYVSNILRKLNILKCPVTIIGYSQGGYLAPKVAELVTETTNVIGLACKFRLAKFNFNKDITYHQIHALNDEIVDFNLSKAEFLKLKELGNTGELIELKDASHFLNEKYINATLDIINRR